MVIDLPADGGDILLGPLLDQEAALVVIEPEAADVGGQHVHVEPDSIPAEALPIGELQCLDD